MTFHDGAIILRPLAVDFTSIPTQVFLVGGLLMSVPVTTLTALAFRRTLKQAELDVELHAWKLRQMLPADAKVTK
jgi:hypothetical protein